MSEDSTNSALSALAAIGLTPEDVDRADLELAEQRKAREAIDRHICACGHASSRHTVMAGIVYCKPSRMECPCKKLRPVLETSDTRLFVRKTDGGGAAHALARGIKAAVEKGRSVRWIVDLVCDRCGEAHANVVPVPVTQTGAAVPRATGYDALLCPECRKEI